MAHEKPEHPYHLVEASVWPLVGSMAAFALFGGAVMYMHDGGAWLMILGLLGVIYTMYAWWGDVIRESISDTYHTPVVKLGLRYGMALFIASEVMFFVAWFWAYFNAALFPYTLTEAGVPMAGVWPPEGIETFDPWHLPFINTLILLLSGTTVTWAHHALLEGNKKELVQGLACTVVLGACFTALQAYEYSHAAFPFSSHEAFSFTEATWGSGIYGSTFYMATGFHGFHVIVGTIMLAVCLIRAMRGHFRADRHFGFEASAWYWHFVDVVWLFLFVVIYVMGAGAGAGAH